MCPVARGKVTVIEAPPTSQPSSPLISSVSATELGEGSGCKDEGIIGVVVGVYHQAMVEHQAGIVHGWGQRSHS